MFKRREYEPEYALLNDPQSQQKNRYGVNIETIAQSDPRRSQDFVINDEALPQQNPNRYKQHGFYFNADNCIACHACEAACSEKNDNPGHIAFRSVGFVESGTYPAYQRINISMACNHCDDPVCLKGCPTRAYTKFAEYGAVLQDPDICFGCGYCTWVCPYNAPQLDPVKGQVSKCNMCVDRLEVGLKPACVSACLGKALDFGVIENIPQGRTQAKTEIPGFPRTDITHPNIRFQQTRTPPHRDVYRVDTTPLKYHRSEKGDSFKPVVDPKLGYKRKWSLKKLLGSHENAHIAFTLSVQMVMGAFLWLFAAQGVEPLQAIKQSPAYLPLLGIMLVIMAFGLFKLNMHLGKPHRFYRGFYNLRMSPVSREIAGVSLFFAGLSGFAFFALFDNSFTYLLQNLFGLIALAGLSGGGYYMYRLYRIKARPFWDHIQTATAFIATGLKLGSLLVAFALLASHSLSIQTGQYLLIAILSGLLLESFGLLLHAKDLKNANNEGAASFYEQLTTFGNAYWLRNLLLLFAISTSIIMLASANHSLAAFILLAVLILPAEIISRALFYVLVIPTTMPGAFFWRNKGFVEHAREVGLANMPQMGVVYERHHAFKISELLDTIKNTSTKEKIDQFKRIFTG